MGNGTFRQRNTELIGISFSTPSLPWPPTVPGWRGCNPKASAAARKKAVVAVARQLAVDLWRLFTGQTTADNLGLIYLPEAA